MIQFLHTLSVTVRGDAKQWHVPGNEEGDPIPEEERHHHGNAKNWQRAHRVIAVRDEIDGTTELLVADKTGEMNWVPLSKCALAKIWVDNTLS